jgi:NTP pyrophosphatase (non-canonical NTP hydrolase)
MTIAEMVERTKQNAIKLGWWKHSIIPISEQIALIHSEASEGLEAFRNNEPISWTDDNGKPQGLASEYADIIIRVAHYAAHLNIDLDYEIDRKLTYNMTRGYRHGNKAI